MSETRTTFSSKLEYDSVTLRNASDVVRFSFIVQNSITFLNLDLCENYNVENVTFVCTEEKSRKIFTPTRSLLYTMHLDIAVGIEHRLKNDQPVTYARCLIPQHLANITLDCVFYCLIISRFIECAFEGTDQHIKLLAFLLNSPFLCKYLYQVDSDISNKLIDLLYTEKCDSPIFKGFIELFNLQTWMCDFEKPDILAFLLYHAHFYGKNFQKGYQSKSVLVDSCIQNNVFLNIKSLLKYIDTPGFCFVAYGSYLYHIKDFRPNLTPEVFTETEKLLAPKRIHMIFQILFLYNNSSQHRRVAASETLHALWNSYPDPFICLEEVEMVFAGEISDEDTRDIYKFYCNSIGEIPSCIEPRTLTQLCRTRIRKTLKENKLWLPEGIALTGLPIPLQSFLNLGEDIQIMSFSRNLDN